MIKIAKLLKSVLLLSFLLLMTNCVTNEADETSNIQSTNEAKIWYANHKEDYNSPILKYIENLKWEDAIISDGIDGKVVEVPFTLVDDLSTSNEKANLHNDHHRLMFIKEGESEFKIYYVQIFTDEINANFIDKDFNFYKIQNDFNGKVFVQDLAKKNISKLKFQKGDVLKPSLTSKMREEALDCVWYGYWYEDGHFEPISLVYCEAGGSTEEPTMPSYGGGGGNSGSTPSAPVMKIIDNLTGKAKCINGLLSTNGNNFVQNIFNQFTGKSEFNIEIVSLPKVYSSTNQEVNGTTGFDKVNSLMTIEISTSRLDGLAALECARIILHEYIHADMYRKLNTTNSKDIDASDFKKVFETYENQHNAMAQVYLSSMKDALKAFHKTVLSTDYNNYVNYYGEVPSDAFYEALAWGGLKDSNVKAWADLTPDKKASINSLANRVPILGKTVPCP
ncbi:hypothetical protein [Flavobacterium ginsenosidimutans]|uniref:Uncharacterized protein n=1 Tax=Flavobacterium ginsenosidimutans TaxID=687844 RepID=A0ABZ2Q421_9FLAO